MCKCGLIRPMTSKEAREYDAHVEALGGPKSPAGKAWIEEQHRLFKKTLRTHRCSGRGR
ncbi:MAG TPA: hypothetical protein VK034_28815 [Enhygromyxa sp.]|nr:hypothetical protein [Enhygromyxa sp.]